MQSQIANSLLNVEELFQEDLRGLSATQEETLRRIAKAAPISVAEFGDDFDADVVQSLVNNRLLVRIGSKYDVYWDIFRDYLNAGRVPIQENYILRMQVGSILKATKILAAANGKLNLADFRLEAGLSEKTFYNVARDMRLLGIAKVDIGTITLQTNLDVGEKDFDAILRLYLRERLRLNRLVWRLIKALESGKSLNLEEMANLLSEWCPYISATKQTWRIYARIFADWMDTTDLGTFDSREGTLILYTPGKELRERKLRLAKRRGGITIPCIQYEPIKKAAIILIQAIIQNTPVDWSNFRKSTIAKSLATLEDLGFISRKTISGKTTILPTPKIINFVKFPDRRQALFAEGALKMNSFSAFIKLLNKYKDSGRTLSQLAEEFRKILGVEWLPNTAELNVKIMLNWARHTGLGPGVFAFKGRRSTKRSLTNKELQKPLFSSFEEN